MATLTVTSKGQVTLKQELLRHLKVAPGQKIEAEKLPDDSVVFKAKKPTGSIDDFIGFFYEPGRKALSIEEINEAIADSWAHRR